MELLGYGLFVLAITAADQISKYFTVADIALGQHVTLIPGFLGLTYAQNTGAAFSIFEGMQWLFAVIFLVFTVLVLVEYRRRSMPFTRLERWCLAAIYGGALGNMIDRLRLGYVVDMIETLFMDFPIFNVADCFITCGCILLVIHLIFFNKAFWKDEKTCA